MWAIAGHNDCTRNVHSRAYNGFLICNNYEKLCQAFCHHTKKIHANTKEYYRI